VGGADRALLAGEREVEDAPGEQGVVTTELQ
jgi:hypothetical protein